MTKPSVEVVELVADAAETDPVELERPLADVIDPRALDNLFDGRATVGEVSFVFYEYEVTVTADGDVDVESVA
ncbi:HalOD1 output domain-containing protein [Haloarcula marina]|uniref:HalOD1 output domain-containing protein n=1 Tax=Haloarcula marina TaxID=2961574 RepID=UPI0020B70451|nr:HalOD1 output domain-containing protein [Halomicroarcula marina]